MVSKTKTPWYTKTGHKLSSACRGLRSFCKDQVLWAEQKLPMNGTPWKRSSRGLSQTPEIFIMKTPVVTPFRKVLHGGAILHKAWNITWKAACENAHKHMDPTIYRHNFLRNGLKSQTRWVAITRINGELIFAFGKLGGQEQTKVNKFIVPGVCFKFQWCLWGVWKSRNPESGTGAGNGNRTGTWTWTGTGTRT